jgi:hypothetical protein
MVREGQHSGIDDDTRRRAMAFAKDADNPMPAVTAKPKLPKQRMVTKKELDASGLSLRDFLNRERGLTRREDKPMSKADAAKQLKLGEKPSKEAVDSAKARLGLENPTEAAYKPRRAPEPLSSTMKPGTNVNYENKDATNETFKKGGSVSASRRADGIAQRGKTRGRVC